MTRLEKLRAMLAARQRMPGYEENCAAIAAEIARLEVEQAKEADNE